VFPVLTPFVRQFMILENLPGCYLGIAQLVQIVNRKSPTGFREGDSVLECQVCINVLELYAFHALGHG
jgi:hypothetical protein